MILRKLFVPACLVAALSFACGTPTNVAQEESVGFDANAKPAATDCCAEKSECSEAKKAECEAKKAECAEKKTCPETGATVDG